MMIGMTKRMSTRETATRARLRGQTKQRRTFTLSPESVALLEQLSAQRNSRGQESVSAVLDDLLMALRREKTRQEMEEKIGRYYDERSEAEREEEIDWGKFAMAEFAAAELIKGRR
jgi:hypothetical protein